jgi:hypothetical protein
MVIQIINKTSTNFSHSQQATPVIKWDQIVRYLAIQMETVIKLQNK